MIPEEEGALADALDGQMGDYLVSNHDQAFGWFAAPRVLSHLRENGWSLIKTDDLARLNEEAWMYRDLKD